MNAKDIARANRRLYQTTSFDRTPKDVFKDTSDVPPDDSPAAAAGGTPGKRAPKARAMKLRADAYADWRQVAAAAISRGESAPAPLASERMPAYEIEIVHEAVSRCATPELVRAAFDICKKGIYLCRHGETDLSRDGNILGWLDFPLNKAGKKGAKKTGEWLFGRDVEQVRSSDLRRARKTARIIADALEIQTIFERAEWYRDWSLGTIDGRPRADVDGLIQVYVAESPDVQVPAGESFNTFLVRFLPRLLALMKTVENPDQTGNVIALVTHSSCLRAAAAWAARGFPVPDDPHKPYTVDKQTFLSLPIPDSAIVHLMLTPDGWRAALIDPLKDELLQKITAAKDTGGDNGTA